MKTAAIAVSILALLLASQSLYQVRSRRTLILLVPKFLGVAWAPYLVLVGMLGAGAGWLVGSPIAIVAGILASFFAADHVRRVTARHDDEFIRAFGPSFRERIRPEAERRMLHRRWSFGVPRAPVARCARDIAFATIPGTERRLLCDVWQPPLGVEPSGTAIVYLHGSAWYLIDKDVGTRPMFQHFAAQGHVVMDVAYRLCPETDFTGMVADAKRAVAWIKQNARDYDARPECIVLMGGSAGGHIALLTAYSADDPRLTPQDLLGVDTSVLAVVSYYGVPDLRAYEAAARVFEPPGALRDSTLREKPGPFGLAMGRWMFGRDLPADRLPPLPQHRQMMRDLVGGLPEEMPERFALASPNAHVGPKSPASLLLQGAHDHIVPVESARSLARALAEAGAKVAYIEYPQTGHAFDLIVPALLAPAGQAALYDVERFLACVREDARPAHLTHPNASIVLLPA